MSKYYTTIWEKPHLVINENTQPKDTLLDPSSLDQEIQKFLTAEGLDVSGNYKILSHNVTDTKYGILKNAYIEYWE